MSIFSSSSSSRTPFLRASYWSNWLIRKKMGTYPHCFFTLRARSAPCALPEDFASARALASTSA